MTGYVVDASVATKWLALEVHSDAARRLGGRGHQFAAPHHFASELANVFRTKSMRGQLSGDEARLAVAGINRLGIELAALPPLLGPAFELALSHQLSVYDALYVALALREGCKFVTADRRLYNSLAGALPQTMLWIEDVPPDA